MLKLFRSVSDMKLYAYLVVIWLGNLEFRRMAKIGLNPMRSD